MKRKDKEPVKLQTEKQRSELRSQENQTDKLKSNGKSEELIERDDVENTPFQIITINKESFGVFGKYRITEPYHTKQQCKVELLNMNWNNVVKIMTLVVETMNSKN